jgi:phosphoribosylformylglycinamidine (FGAM) synthase-like amidotransferase family enzyme
VLRIPIGHGEGNYYAPPDVLERIEANRQVVFRYTTADGHLNDEANPNGSVHAIAGVCNEHRNVVGMMPHPERCVEDMLGNDAGRLIFMSMFDTLKKAKQQIKMVGAG